MLRCILKISNEGEGHWRIDDDGFLRVTACVLRSGVFPYAKKDLPAELTNARPELDVWRVRIPEDAFGSEFLKSSEGKPVIAWRHEWQEADGADKEPAVGALAGAPAVQDGRQIMDALITNADTIAAVKAGDLQEVSAGYHSTVEILNGDPDADAVQRPISMNHVVLLPAGRGRCGHTVRILNQKDTKMVTVKLMNAGGEEKEYRFTNEEDAKVAQEMVSDQAAKGEAEKDALKATAAESEKKAAGDMEAKNHELAESQSKFAEIDQTMKAMEAQKILLEQQIKQYESEEYQSGVAKERGEFDAGEKSVMENCSDGEKKEAEAKLQNAKTLDERRKVIVGVICNSRGIPYDEANAKALFPVIVKTLNKATVTEVRQPVTKKQDKGDAPVHPVFAKRG